MAWIKIRTGMASLKTINVMVANKIYNIKSPDVVFEVKYCWNDWVKKNGVRANLVQYDSPNFIPLLILPLVLV